MKNLLLINLLLLACLPPLPSVNYTPLVFDYPKNDYKYKSYQEVKVYNADEFPGLNIALYCKVIGVASINLTPLFEKDWTADQAIEALKREAFKRKAHAIVIKFTQSSVNIPPGSISDFSGLTNPYGGIYSFQFGGFTKHNTYIDCAFIVF